MGHGTTVALGSLGTVFSGLVLARAQSEVAAMEQIPVLVARDVGETLAPQDEIGRLRLVPDAASRFHLHEGDVVITARGSVVRAAVATVEHVGVVLGPNLIAVRLGARLLPLLLAAYLRLPAVQGILLGVRKGAAVPALTVGDLNRLRIVLPPPDRQEALRRFVDLSTTYSATVARAAAARAAASADLVARILSPEEGILP